MAEHNQTTVNWDGFIISLTPREEVEDYILNIEVLYKDTGAKMFHGTIERDGCSDFRFQVSDTNYWTHICSLSHFADMLKYVNEAANRYFELASNCPNCHNDYGADSIEFWKYVWSGRDFCQKCLDSFKKFAPTQ